jgi:hypothetical protein
MGCSKVLFSKRDVEKNGFQGFNTSAAEGWNFFSIDKHFV